MIAEQDDVEACTMGIASKKGRKGEMIKVKNESSEREVNATVIDMSVVRTGYASVRKAPPHLSYPFNAPLIPDKVPGKALSPGRPGEKKP
ncbi:flagella basal body P-ring formation protein FlgA [Enterobacter ludwigii]|uniref:flagella basal body P-ring formation protein FlgA n=1 Tax=Enterobacter ludwigii TaxID=299767 RepID=UPI003F72CC0E